MKTNFSKKDFIFCKDGKKYELYAECLYSEGRYIAGKVYARRYFRTIKQAIACASNLPNNLAWRLIRIKDGKNYTRKLYPNY